MNIPLGNWLNPFSKRSINPDDVKKDLGNFIAPVQLQRIRQDVASWRDSIVESENVWYPHRVKQQKLYIDTILNAQVSACMDRRRDLTMLRKWDFVNSKGKSDDKTLSYFLDVVNGQSQMKRWFNDYVNYSWDALAYGYSLISLGDLENDTFPNLSIIKRWNISPDRLNVTNFIYSLSGAQFMEDPYKNWHCYIPTTNEIGTSPCGYGFLYKVGIYEIFLRNLLGFNGDFVELFAQPYRVGKTTKTDEKERTEFASMLQQMGSSGWAMLDPDDAIEFIETALGGTGYNGYDNFEQRLEKKISKIILGHADAIDSIPGKLGNSKEKSPAEKAMEDKQTRDGLFVMNSVNDILIPRMRALGFNIPDDVKAVLKNDSEIMELNNSIIAQAVEMTRGGLQMDMAYFTKQTGIPVSAPAIPNKPEFKESVKNKLDKLYGKHEH